MGEAAAIWDRRYSGGRSGVYEPWLDRWKTILVGHGDQALELGCGVGHDTEVLISWGFEVTALDVSRVAIEHSRQRNPGAIHRVMDLRNIGSLISGFDVVVASLSLHYFNRGETIAVFKSVHDLLNPGGVFAFRVNAFDDGEWGASGDVRSWERICIDGVSKQFFTPEKIATVLRGRWQILSQEKMSTSRFGPRKSFFEVIAQIPFE